MNWAASRKRAQTAEELGMRYLSGVEISVTWASRTVHIVGLNVDPACQALIDGLARTRNGRAARAEAIGELLATMGVPNAYEGALKYVSNPDMISRTHFARFMVESGYAELDPGRVHPLSGRRQAGIHRPSLVKTG